MMCIYLFFLTDKTESTKTPQDEKKETFTQTHFQGTAGILRVLVGEMVGETENQKLYILLPFLYLTFIFPDNPSFFPLRLSEYKYIYKYKYYNYTPSNCTLINILT